MRQASYFSRFLLRAHHPNVPSAKLPGGQFLTLKGVEQDIILQDPLTATSHCAFRSAPGVFLPAMCLNALLQCTNLHPFPVRQKTMPAQPQRKKKTKAK